MSVTISEELAVAILAELGEWGAECGEIASEVRTDEEEESYTAKGEHIGELVAQLEQAIKEVGESNEEDDTPNAWMEH